MKFIILDAGSVSIKFVVLYKKKNKLYSRYERHKGHPFTVAFGLIKKSLG